MEKNKLTQKQKNIAIEHMRDLYDKSEEMTQICNILKEIKENLSRIESLLSKKNK